jgi:hypothetical protein
MTAASGLYGALQRSWDVASEEILRPSDRLSVNLGAGLNISSAAPLYSVYPPSPSSHKYVPAWGRSEGCLLRWKDCRMQGGGAGRSVPSTRSNTSWVPARLEQLYHRRCHIKETRPRMRTDDDTSD